MEKTFFAVLAVILLLAPKNLSGQQLNRPESIDYDSISKTYYISNYGDSGNGYVTIIPPAGQRPFILKKAGNGSYAGIKKFKNYIICAIDHDKAPDEIVFFDPISLEVIKSITIQGTQQLNDIEVDKDRNIVYVSDRVGNQIYAVNPDENTYKALLEENKIKIPNGLYYDQPTGQLYICTTRPTQNEIMTYDVKTKKLQTLMELEAPHLDGIIVDKNGIVYTTSWSRDWKSSQLLSINMKDKTISKLMENDFGMADIAYDKQANRILIPSFYKNKIDEFQISETK